MRPSRPSCLLVTMLISCGCWSSGPPGAVTDADVARVACDRASDVTREWSQGQYSDRPAAVRAFYERVICSEWERAIGSRRCVWPLTRVRDVVLDAGALRASTPGCTDLADLFELNAPP